MTDPIRDRLLDAAERRARAGGYNGFSFRELAGDVGIKSASVHYHFPTKADLAEALVRRYTSRAEERLGSPDGLSRPEAVARVGALFRDALVRDDRMCLCGLFGAERDALPTTVADATAGFFRFLIDYLDASEDDEGGPTPAAVLASLEGALILARTLRDPAIFDEALWPARTGAAPRPRGT